MKGIRRLTALALAAALFAFPSCPWFRASADDLPEASIPCEAVEVFVEEVEPPVAELGAFELGCDPDGGLVADDESVTEESPDPALSETPAEPFCQEMIVEGAQIFVTADADVFSEDAVLSVKAIEDGAWEEAVEKALGIEPDGHCIVYHKKFGFSGAVPNGTAHVMMGISEYGDLPEAYPDAEIFAYVMYLDLEREDAEVLQVDADIDLHSNWVMFPLEAPSVYDVIYVIRLPRTDEGIETPTDEPEPAEAPEPQPEPMEAPEPQPEPAEAPEPQPEPAEAPEPQPEPAEAPEPQPEPMEAPEPQPEPMEAPEPQPEPMEAPEPQPEPMEAPEQQPETTEEPEQADPTDEPEGEEAEPQVRITASSVHTQPCYYFSDGYVILLVNDAPEEGFCWAFDGVPLYATDIGEYLLPIPNGYSSEESLSEEGMEKLSLEPGSATLLIFNGDVNLDGEVNIADANIVSQLINEGDSYYDSDQLPLYQRVLADTDRDMRYTISDINMIVDCINSLQ